MEIKKLKENNFFKVSGYLPEAPIKEIDENGKLYCFFELSVKFLSQRVSLPLVIVGSKVDAFVTSARKYTRVKVEGMFVSFHDRLNLRVTHYVILDNTSVTARPSDRFKKVVKLYSLEGINERAKKNK